MAENVPVSVTGAQTQQTPEKLNRTIEGLHRSLGRSQQQVGALRQENQGGDAEPANLLSAVGAGD